MRLATGAVGAVLVTILAGSAHAQGASASPTPAGAPPPPPAIADGLGPELPLTPPSSVAPLPQSPTPDPPQSPLRPIGEVVIGGVLGTAGLIGGAFGGFATQCALGCRGEFGGIEGLLLGAAVGLTTATAAGVMLAGSDREHTASFGWTWLGAIAGGTLALFPATRSHDGTAALVIVSGGTALGATIAFELSRTRSKPSTAVRLVPLISGGSVQLALVGAR